MKPHPQIRFLIWQCKFLLRGASLLVPKAERAAWYQEWFGEIWHWLHFLAESGRLNSHTSMELTRHCWGAFPDAAFHRFDHKKVTRVLDDKGAVRRYVNVFLNDEDIRFLRELATPVADADRITLIPAIAGG